MTQRGRWTLWAVVLYAVILAAVAAGLGGLYAASRDRLDEAMGARLLAVANSLAGLIDPDRVFALTLGVSTEPDYLDELAGQLERIQDANKLAEITLTNPDGGIVIYSTLDNLRPGEPNDFWMLDPAAVGSARDGFSQATRLYRLQETYQKSAYAPILLDDLASGEPTAAAIVTVSGNPDFFDSLARLRRGALITGAVVLAVLLLLGGFLYRVNRSFERYQASILQQENLAAMGRMTAGIAHEIRNPLGIIRGAGQHLETVLADAGIEDETVAFIPEEVDRLDRILSGYLAFGTDRAAPAEVFELERVVRRSARLLAGELAERGIELDWIGETPVRVSADPLRLQQVVMNLLLNAADAMPEGGRIEIGFGEEERRAVVTVADEGTGLGGVDPEPLFEPFRTTKEKGSGLGLALSRRIVAEAGGSLDLAERGDRTGAVAVLHLPVHDETPA